MMTEFEWKAMTPEQREIHYNRNRHCEHIYEYPGVETEPGVFDKTNERLRESYSFDPYFHTAHMEPCTKEKKCACAMCSQKIGIERSGRFT